MKTAILVLSHQGRSFLQEWGEVIAELGFEGHVLSSRPTIHVNQWRQSLPKSFVCSRVTFQYSLDYSEVETAVRELQVRYDRVLVVTVWELYRDFACRANHDLKNSDTTTSQIAGLRDKFRLRRALNELGLSSKKIEILTETTLRTAQKSESPKFIKPRFGIASHTAFRLRPEMTWNELNLLSSNLIFDSDYGMYFSKDSSLLIEDYIEGREFSFEILAGGGEIVVLAAHEKVEVDHQARTTLENACVSPPIESEVLKNADLVENWLRLIFSELQVLEGLFHVEARFDGKVWEIIEINPRLGGAFIYHSAKIASGESLMKWSLLLSLERDAGRRREMIRKLQPAGLLGQLSKPVLNRTFFRVFFAEPGREIHQVVVQNNGLPPPDISKCFIQTGKTPLANRELFLGQALWRVDETWGGVDAYITQSQTYLAAQYRNTSPSFEPSENPEAGALK